MTICLFFSEWRRESYMTNLWEGNFYDGIDDEELTPREIVQSQCQELAEMTDNTIIARISDYDGIPYSYTKNALAGVLSAKAIWGENHNIQDELGEVEEDEKIAYEFFITSRKTPKYKFRAFIMYHSVVIYPVYFSIEDDIAKEIGVEAETQVATEEEFEQLLKKVLNSKRLEKVIRNLLRLNR